MSTWNQAILVRAVLTPDQAQRLAAKVIAWLADERIILDLPTDREFYDGPCYPPGPEFLKAHDVDSFGPNLSSYVTSFSSSDNAMQLLVSRGRVLNGQGRYLPPQCPRCQQPVDFYDLLHAGEAWISGECEVLRCPRCEQGSELPLWEHDDIAYVMLAFEFGEWAVLSERFVAAVGDKLGFRVTLLTGKH